MPTPIPSHHPDANIPPRAWGNRDATVAKSVGRSGGDATRFEQSESTVDQSERLAAVDQIVSGLAHGCRNALQRSRACLELLELDLADHPQDVELIHYTQQALSDLQGLYEQVRRYAAPLTLQMAPTDIREVVIEAWEALCSVQGDHSVHLHISDDGGTLRACCDRKRIQQVVYNVLENARTAAPAGSDVQVSGDSTEVEGKPAVTIRVRDHGAGMNDEQLARIFEPLYTTKTRASGLGLAVARRIIQAHGGEIHAASQPGEGTEIVFTLPRDPHGPPSPP